MTSYILGSVIDWEKWINQNSAVCIDCAEGCLLDSVVYDCKNGIAFFFEHYLNSNSSGYEMLFFRHKETENNKDYEEAWKRLAQLQEE